MKKSKHKVIKMRTTGGDVFTINRIDNKDLIPVIPIRYYKTRKGALRGLERRKKL